VGSRVRAVCIHGHYYQPPREHPWLGVVEPEPSAAPDPDWNVRILRECYAPNAAARLLDAHGRLRGLVSNYAWTSFNVGPTLDAWFVRHAPSLIADLVQADRESLARTGHGNAWAQAYNHPILPLCTARDRRTQVRWGARAFELRYGRRPDGMWLPEMAVDLATLEALAAEGIGLTMLSPHQVRRVRPLGGAAWTDVTPDTLDRRRLYRCPLPSGAVIDVVVRDDGLSRGLAFGELLRDGGLLAERLTAAVGDADADVLVTAATDGETFGHHHHFGEMAVAYTIERLRREGNVTVTNPAAFRAAVPPSHEMELAEATSWSCAHGIERWRSGCACRVVGPAEWTTAWRQGLREAVDWLRDALDGVFERAGGAALRDPWEARDGYVDALVDPAKTDAVVGAALRAGATAADRLQARRALEMARHGLLMQTSCGWFFDDVAGVEATLVMRQGGRAIDLARALGAELEDGFVQRLATAKSNVPSEGTAADVYRRAVQGRPVTSARVAATGVILDRLGEAATLPGYEIELSSGEELVVAGVTELATGAQVDVEVRASPHGAVPSAEAEGRRYGVGDLFLPQRARVMRTVAGHAMRAVGEARDAALANVRNVIDPLIARDPILPLGLALLLGEAEADRLIGLVRETETALPMLAAKIEALRERGVTMPAQRLAHALCERLLAALRRLPDGVGDALDVLDLARTAGIVLDLAEPQLVVARWWQDARPREVAAPLVTLRNRLDLSPELSSAG
jgi:alpha-amylase/alpha-mannosidase (GH57 family)